MRRGLGARRGVSARNCGRVQHRVGLTDRKGCGCCAPRRCVEHRPGPVALEGWRPLRSVRGAELIAPGGPAFRYLAVMNGAVCGGLHLIWLDAERRAPGAIAAVTERRLRSDRAN